MIKSGYKFVLFFALSQFFCFNAALYCQQHQRAIDSLNAIIAQSGKKSDTTKVSALLKLSAFFQRTNIDTSILLVKQAITLSAKSDNNKSLANSYRRLGILYHRKSQFDSAILHYSKANVYFEILNEKVEVVNNDIFISTCLIDIGEYKRALISLLNALKVAERLQSRELQKKCFTNIGVVYYYQSDYIKAGDYFSKAINLCDPENDQFLMAKLYTNIGLIYSSQQHSREAIDNLEKSLKLYTWLDNKQGMADAYLNIGIEYTTLKNYGVADKYSFKALAIYEAITDRIGVSRVLSNISSSKIQQGKYHEAIKLANQALVISKTIGTLSIEKDIYNTLSDCYEKLKVYNKALDYHKLYVSLNDSLFNQEKHKQLADLEAKYHNEKKQKEIDVKNAEIVRKNMGLYALLVILLLLVGLIVVIFRSNTQKQKAYSILAQQKTEIVLINKGLEELNRDKDRFMAILAHDLKGPFNAILGFLDLLKLNVRVYSIDTIEKQVKILNTSAHQVYSLLENLLLWSGTQSGKISFNPQTLNLNETCCEVFEALKQNAIAKDITVNCNTLGISIYADEFMVKTILRNLVSNAIKFCNKGGEINVYAETSNDGVKIKISDNGVGMPRETIAKLFDISHLQTTEGTAKEKGTGLGLFICKDFIEKHGGKIWAESEVGQGSDFIFTLPAIS